MTKDLPRKTNCLWKGHEEGKKALAVGEGRLQRPAQVKGVTDRQNHVLTHNSRNGFHVATASKNNVEGSTAGRCTTAWIPSRHGITLRRKVRRGGEGEEQ
ncbi:hypothetical protein AAFF_G00222570 [Aldrovandia affinis]|uniref:Uncharacterized protein n=1 Tax=Aldrovandia affinis TaxID=143900 RepID=A0AAD7RFG3_9TELE|nr:hypothetical protein AAFF_G00222570 [Aldrovandia affinis]